jgi:hypothetical protein
MAQYGFIRDKLDMKVLVLYLMARTAGPIDYACLTDLCMCDEGVDYFMFSQAVAELVLSEHLQVEQELYSITDKGRKNGAVWEESLPFSVRQKCDRNLILLNAKLRQAEQIRAQAIPREGGGFTVRMILDDNQGNLMTLELYAPTQEQADRQCASFRAQPDRIYRALLSSLTEDEDPKE